MSSIVKCNNCNIVINEVLAFIQNKLDVMDQESLVRICSTAFTSMEIEAAKSLLFESVPTKRRIITRRRDGKIQRDLDDIIVLFHEVDPDHMPIFVAKDLYKLPPVTFDHIDATRLLKDILVLQKELKDIKECSATKEQVVALEIEVSNIQRASLLNNFDRNVNTKRGTSSVDLDSGPAGAAHMTSCEQSQWELEESILEAEFQDAAQNFDVPSSPRAPELSPPVPVHRKPDSPKQRAPTPPPPPSPPPSPSSHSERPAPANKGKSDHNKWVEVVKRKSKLRQNGFNSMRSKGCEDEKLKAALNKVPIFITNVHKDTTDKDIADYVYRKTQETVSVVRLSIKNEAKHNAFKVFVPRQKLWLFLNEQFWPTGIVYRRFVNVKSGKK